MDIDILLFLQELRNTLPEIVTSIFSIITQFSALGVAIVVMIYWLFHKEKGLFMLRVVVMSNVCMQTLKNIFCVNRPWVRDSRVQPYEGAIHHATGYSFPSGHSTFASASYGSMISQFREKKWVKWVLIPLILCIGFSRNFLGVHTPQDVIVGLCIGVIGIICVVYSEKKGWAYTKRWYLASACLLVILGIFTVVKPYPDTMSVNDIIYMQKDAIQSFGLGMGFLLGVYLERKYIRFTTDNLSKIMIAKRLACGVVTLGITYLALKFGLKPFVEIRVYACVQGFLLALFAIAGVPYLFQKIDK